MIKSSRSAFTLIELILVIAIIVILAVTSVLVSGGIIERARLASDQASVTNLNRITRIYRMQEHSNDPFAEQSRTSVYLMGLLVDSGYLDAVYTARTKDAEIKWIIDLEKWHLNFSDSFYRISVSDGVKFDTSGGLAGRIWGSYSGDSRDIVIPAQLDGVSVSMIYQDVFKGKELVSVEFEEGSLVSRIHARAFFDNELSEIILPASVERIDLWAFRNNNISQITLPDKLHTIEDLAFEGNKLNQVTIGSGVRSIGSRAFGKETEQFVKAYNDGGAGTYELINGVWVKR